jgi:hypothetical protein
MFTDLLGVAAAGPVAPLTSAASRGSAADDRARHRHRSLRRWLGEA